MTHTESLALLRDARDLLNDPPHVRFLRGRRAVRSAIMSQIDAHLAALAIAVVPHRAVAVARARCFNTVGIEIDADERETRRRVDGIWVRAWVRVSDDDLAADDNVARRVDPERYRAIVMALPALTRDIFLLHRVDGLDYATIAAHRGVSVDTVERHIADALIQIDRGLDGEFL